MTDWKRLALDSAHSLEYLLNIIGKNASIGGKPARLAKRIHDDILRLSADDKKEEQVICLNAKGKPKTVLDILSDTFESYSVDQHHGPPCPQITIKLQVQDIVPKELKEEIERSSAYYGGPSIIKYEAL